MHDYYDLRYHLLVHILGVYSALNCVGSSLCKSSLVKSTHDLCTSVLDVVYAYNLAISSTRGTHYYNNQ